MSAIRELARMAAPTVPTEPTSVEYVTDPLAAERAVEEIWALPQVGYDSETTALSPLDGRQRLAQFAAPDGRCWVFDLDRVGGGRVARLLSRRGQVRVGQNLKFDQKFAARQLGVPDLGPVYDTMLAGQLLSFGDMSEEHNLAALARDELGVRLPKEQQTSDWARPELSKEQIDYAARDALIPLALQEAQTHRLRAEGLTGIADIEFGAVAPLAAMEMQGINLDAERWLALCAQNHAERLDVQVALSRAFRPNYQALFDDIPADINLGSHIQVKEALHKLGIPVPLDKDGKETTREYKLQPLALQHPEVALLLKYRKLEKRDKSYGPKWVGYAHPATGRIHLDLNQIGAETGRIQGREPNLLQIPRHKETRACFIPPPGWVFVDADYSQFELRILAELCRDANFCRAFIEDKDFHRYSAWMIEQMAGRHCAEGEVTDEARGIAKNLNFGIVYGIGVARYAFTTGLSLEQAEQVFKYYFGAFSGLKHWLDRQARNTVKTLQARTMAGRKIVYKQDVHNSKEDRAAVERYGKNYPIQGTNADITKRALRYVWNEIAGHDHVKPVLVIHDEILLAARPDYAEWARQMLTYQMLRAAREYVFAVPVKVGAEITTVWQKT